MATQEEVAKHLNITDRWVRELQKEPGAPKNRKWGEYDIDTWRYFYLSYLQRGEKVGSGENGNDDYEEKLLIARWKLTEEQAVTQKLKNQVTEGEMVDTGFCIFALSRLAMDLSNQEWIPFGHSLNER